MSYRFHTISRQTETANKIAMSSPRLLVLFLLWAGLVTGTQGSRLGECKTPHAMTTQVQCSQDEDCATPKKCCLTLGGGATCQVPASDCSQLTCSPCIIHQTSGFALCAVPGNWGEWGTFGDCSATCGGGTQERRRTCDNPPPANGGAGCQGDSSETQACNMDPCPVDGNWGEWTSYGPCSRPCGGGTQERRRTCDNPPPAYGGAGCQGDSAETQACNTDPCPPQNCRDLQQLGGCSVSCTVYPDYVNQVNVLCLLDETVIVYRNDPTFNFYRSWDEYKYGFTSGDLDFWIGLENLHRLLTSNPFVSSWKLKIYADSETFFFSAEYTNVTLSGSADGYRLNAVFLQSTVAEDPLSTAYGQPFSTFDHDQDGDDSRNCAELHHGAWWYQGASGTDSCGTTNLFGILRSSSALQSTYFKTPNEFYNFTVFAILVQPL